MIPPSTNNDGDTILEHMGQLSLSSATPTDGPLFPQAGKLCEKQEAPKITSQIVSNHPANTPLTRAPSASSLGSSERSSTPKLRNRASLSSLKGPQGKTPPLSPALRRTSSYFQSSPNATMNARSSLAPPPEEPQKPALTTASVARDFFAMDLEANHGGSEIKSDAQVVVILQDDCYGHRYSRPRTSKSNLNTIVERPERIHAALLGVATAYVRIGGRHAGGHAAPHPKYEPTTLPSPPFKIHKTVRRLSLRSPAVTGVHGVDWMNELSKMCSAAESRLAVGGKELTRSLGLGQDKGTSHESKAKLHEGDLYLCAGSLDAFEGALGGVCEAVDVAFAEKGSRRAFVCIRPPGHHCSADMPSGFCWLNNVHVGIAHASAAHGLTHAAIIDIDLHHGDGSQAITWEHNVKVASLPKNTPLSKKTAIGYFSLHDINSYPCEMGDDDKIRNASLCIENAHGQSIWNVHLQPWRTEAEFWMLYEDRYSVILAKARAFLLETTNRLRQAPTHQSPKAAIFISAGFDASEWESPHMQRHQVNVPTNFYARLSHDVVMIAEEEGLGVDGRVISVLEGGYSDRALMSGVLSHISGLSVPSQTSKLSSANDGLGLERSSRLGNRKLITDVGEKHEISQPGVATPLDADWWSLSSLEELEATVKPPSAVAPKKQRGDVKPTYTTITESYKAKVISSPPGRRSSSDISVGNNGSISAETRASSLPPPQVDWATAAHELSKLLIPNDRQTRSCKPEELNAEASRARRDRQSGIGLHTDAIPLDAERMRLREKRPKQIPRNDLQETKLPSRTSRRKTVADVKLLSSETEGSSPLSDPMTAGQRKRPTQRRSSAASSVTSLNTDQGSELSMTSIAEVSPQQDALGPKKSRAPAIPRSDPNKAKAAKKPMLATRLPSSTSLPAKVVNNDAPSLPNQVPEKMPSSVNEDLKTQDVDRLSSNMKKMSIKLNVPPKEEYEAKQTKIKGPARARPTKATAVKVAKPSSPTKKKPKTSSPSKAKAKIAATVPTEAPPSGDVLMASNSDPPVAPTDIAAEDNPLKQPSTVQLPSQPPAAFPASSVASQLLADSEELSPTYETAPTLNLSAVRSKDPDLASLPPMSLSLPTPMSLQPSTPVTVRRTRGDLPVFTSTSPISFSNNAPAPLSLEIDHKVIAGDVQSRNGFQATIVSSSEASTSAQSHPYEDKHENGQFSQPLNAQAQQQQQQQQQQRRSIWDVPETPEQRKP